MRAVHRALAEDDPAALLAPLADSRSHLLDSHAGLADQIASVTDQTDHVRQAAHEQRAHLPGDAP
ncbi:hypothetical protein GCM10029964_065830 [Kibdelosporangium lantanae]